jgi:hypothetical protein
VISRDTLDASAGNLGAADEVSAADHDGDLHTIVHERLYLFSQPTGQFGINAVLMFAGKHFTR